MKKILVLLSVAVFVVGLAGLAFAETVTKIVGNNVTVRDDMGREKTIESHLKGLKVGDKVKLTAKDGLTWLNPQPEPPKPPDPTKLEKIKPVDLKNSVLQKKGISTPEQPTPPPPSESPKLK